MAFCYSTAVFCFVVVVVVVVAVVVVVVVVAAVRQVCCSVHEAFAEVVAPAANACPVFVLLIMITSLCNWLCFFGCC